MNIRLWFIVVTIPVFSACSSSNSGSTTPLPVLESVNQISLGDLTSVIRLATVKKEGTGFIVASDAAMNVIGSSLVSGEDNDVAIELIRPVSDDEAITVTLHADSNSSGSFEAGTDLAVQATGGGDINTSANITVPANTPDVRLSMTANGSSSWSISAEPSVYNWGNVASGTNPALTVSAPGLRFEVVNPSLLSHPFGLIDANNADRELITQRHGATAGTGTYYSDGGVDIDDSGNNFHFTLTAALAAEVTHYRCDFHPLFMIGTITIM